MLKPWLYGLLAATLLAGCASSPAPERDPSANRTAAVPAHDSPMVGPRWNLILLGTAERWSSDQPAYIEVTSDNGQLRLSGSNGCNRINGRVHLDDGNRVNIDGLASTRMACPNMADAQRINELLENAYRYLVDHDRLVFFGSDSRVLGGFQRR